MIGFDQAGVRRLAPRLMVLLALLALATIQPLRADGPPTREAYRTVVVEVITLVERAEREPLTEARRALLGEAANMLAAVREVEWDAAVVLPVDNEPLAALLRESASSTSDVRTARSRLLALRDALGAPPGPLMSAGEYARLNEIFAAPPFRTEPRLDNWLLAQLAEFLARLLGNAAGGIFSMREVIVVLGLLLLVLLLAYFAVNLRLHGAADASLPGASGEARPTSSEAFAGAQQLAAAGDLRTAVRHLYLSTLLWLDEHGHLRYDRSLTNREVLRAVAPAPALHGALAPLVESFDSIWYGFAPVSAADFERYRQGVDAVRRL